MLLEPVSYWSLIFSCRNKSSLPGKVLSINGSVECKWFVIMYVQPVKKKKKIKKKKNSFTRGPYEVHQITPHFYRATPNLHVSDWQIGSMVSWKFPSYRNLTVCSKKLEWGIIYQGDTELVFHSLWQRWIVKVVAIVGRYYETPWNAV